MASSVFKETLVKALGKKYRGRITAQQALILEKSVVKKGALVSTMVERAQGKGETLSELDIENFYDAANTRVNGILELMADEDVEKLFNQTSFRADKKSKTKVTGGAFLRDKKGRFISPFNLERLLNLTLFNKAQEHMGVNGQLKNRTGRLANSGAVTGIVTNKETRTASFYFTYMLYPYEVFENHPEKFAGGLSYSPIKLFKDAINSALDDLLSRTTLDTVDMNSIFKGGRQ